MAKELFTIGYQGRTIDAFIDALHANGVECVLDVREMPISRKPGFSKTRLGERLASEGILYVHMRELGTPRSLRNALKSNGDYVTFFEDMDRFIDAKGRAIDDARTYVDEKSCCLMCFERLAAECHRKVVAAKIKERDGNGLRIRNL